MYQKRARNLFTSFQHLRIIEHRSDAIYSKKMHPPLMLFCPYYDRFMKQVNRLICFRIIYIFVKNKTEKQNMHELKN